MIRATHARYVLDASVAAKWFTRHDETDRHKAVALRALHQSGRCTLVVPEFSLLEILNAVRFSVRASPINASMRAGSSAGPGPSAGESDLPSMFMSSVGRAFAQAAGFPTPDRR